jgi:hypothetical protein
MPKNKIYKFLVPIAVVFLILTFWFIFVTQKEFRLLPSDVESDISIQLKSVGKSVQVGITNDSVYTIGSIKLSCTSVIRTRDCSMMGMVMGNQLDDKSRCKIIVNDINESLIQRPIITRATYNKYFETKESWRPDSLSCRTEDPRGYKSLWPERIIGWILF